MPKDRKQTFSDRQSQAAREKKQAVKIKPAEDASPAAAVESAPAKKNEKLRAGAKGKASK